MKKLKTGVVRAWGCYIKGTKYMAGMWGGPAIFKTKVKAIMFSDLVTNTEPRRIEIREVKK
jgi:hypothetical protein